MHFLNPIVIVQAFGILGVALAIFAESAILLFIFLPGDSLLFVAGLFAAKGFLNIYLLVALVALAAIIGGSVGYWFGKKAGDALFTREESFFFKKSYITRTKKFYDTYGSKTLVIARFIPAVRTVAPVLAGAVRMPHRSFLKWNIVGGILWILVASLAGYFLGTIFPGSVHYITYIAVAIIIVSLIPPVLEYRKETRDASVSETKSI